MALSIVKTKYGTLEGVPGNNRSFTVFRGIPFAKPPVQELRFAAPQPPESWDGVLLCDKFKSACIQPFSNVGHPHFVKEFYSVPTKNSEDCLYLNVWTPADSSDAKLPVMFWIHGGGFGSGYSYEQEFDGEAFNKRGVILVTCAYRCNVLGFFAHHALAEKDAHSSTGNYGLLDQIAALRWVKECIAAFGGDPENITVFGQSAGGISTRILLTSSLSKNLFQRGIVQSGGGVVDADLVRSFEEKCDVCERAMKLLGWQIEDLYQHTGEELQEEISQAVNEVLEGKAMFFFQPSIDDYVLADAPGKLIALGGADGKDILCGTVSGDAWMFAGAALEHIREDLPLKQRAYAFAPSVSWAQNVLHRGQKPIYTYFFERNLPGDDNGAWHAGEIWYVHGTMSRCWRPWSGYDYELSDIMCDYWTSFAKCGNPNTEGLPAWPAYTEDNPMTMDFTDDGVQAVKLIQCKTEQRIVNYMEEHPGLLDTDPGI